MHHIQDVINQLFRKMPYDVLAGVHISGEEIYANVPNWVSYEEPAAEESASEPVAA
jgi:hypothetical protein